MEGTGLPGAKVEGAGLSGAKVSGIRYLDAMVGFCFTLLKSAEERREGTGLPGAKVDRMFQASYN